MASVVRKPGMSVCNMANRLVNYKDMSSHIILYVHVTSGQVSLISICQCLQASAVPSIKPDRHPTTHVMSIASLVPSG